MFQNATFNGPNVYVTPVTGAQFTPFTAAHDGYLTGSGPLNVGLDGNFMQWAGPTVDIPDHYVFPLGGRHHWRLRFNGPAAAPSSAAVILDSGGCAILRLMALAFTASALFLEAMLPPHYKLHRNCVWLGLFHWRIEHLHTYSGISGARADSLKPAPARSPWMARSMQHLHRFHGHQQRVLQIGSGAAAQDWDCWVRAT